MNIRRVRMVNFTVHEHTELAFPSRGVVLVVGPNGSGKSSVVEAVSVGLWGRTLRGAPPWREGTTGVVNVDTPDLQVARTRDRGKVSLSFGPDVQYDTVTKAQAALESRVGPWDVWRRTSVFSSADAAHFSLASDGDRKRMLEALLGLAVFDTALDACKHDLRAAEGVAREHGTRLAILRERLAAAERALETARSEAGAARASLPPPGPTRDVRSLYDAACADLAEVHQRLRAVSRERGAAEARAQEFTTRLRALQGGTCPTCQRPVPGDLLATLARSVDSARADGARLVAAVEAETAVLEAQARELTDERDAFHSRMRATDKANSARAAHGSALRRAQQAEGVASRTATEVNAALANLAAQHARAEREVAALALCADVLGLRGVRAHMLGRALAGIESVANGWLRRIAGPHLSVSLRPHTERKGGGVADVIAMHITGAGGGEGYTAASNGERRRIDVSLLLALAQLSSSAAGREPGTLFFDEVFDALDSDGTAAVCEALQELSVDRAVVVISHSEAITHALRPAARWCVDGGRVRVV